jgi:hypothetical protein
MKLLPVDAWPDADLQLWDMTFRYGNILEDD